MILKAKWMSDTVYFLDTEKYNTDFGSCCLITPFLNFELKKMSTEINGIDYHSVPKGMRNGIQNGLEVVIDVESFENAYFPRQAIGIAAVVADARDKVVVQQSGFNIAPGNDD